MMSPSRPSGDCCEGGRRRTLVSSGQLTRFALQSPLSREALDEFLAAFEDSGLDDDERFTLMEVMLQSFGDLGRFLREDAREPPRPWSLPHRGVREPRRGPRL